MATLPSMTPVHRLARVLEIAVVGLLVLAGVAFLVASPAHRLGPSIVVWCMAGVGLVAFELRFAGHRRRVARVGATLRQIASRVLESPGPILDRSGDPFVRELAASPLLGSVMAGRTSALGVQGKAGGHDMEIGTAIMAARDLDITMSYVRLPGLPASTALRVTTAGAPGAFGRTGAPGHQVATGDAAFDAKWAVDADESVARSLLDTDTRRHLLDLGARLPRHGHASIETTRFGLLVRWPGELSEPLAGELRDVALAMQQRLAATA